MLEFAAKIREHEELAEENCFGGLYQGALVRGSGLKASTGNAKLAPSGPHKVEDAQGMLPTADF